MFIDHVEILLKAGDGGKGCRSFYRDKYKRDGSPDGGDGGKGADIVILADKSLYTLYDFKFKHEFRAHHGGHGSSKGKKGAVGPDVIIRVPVGTVVIDKETGAKLRDLDTEGAALVAARGGKGGLGNRHKSEATLGEPGEERAVILDLRVIADVGIIGFPNSGKSTLISAVSNAHPKIASYPFTTKSPILGVVNRDERVFVLADIPGLIEGSAQGKGLGDKFLRHIERTRLLLHVLDMAGVDGRDPLQDYKVINQELKFYSREVAVKHQIIVANKMDLEGAKENLERFKKAIRKKVYPISALNKEGLEELLGAIEKKI
ncbi:MAG: GTPase ObgE [Candidatus Omnitrophica bacterium]|nr:GTPase ObgE [Candidatus Omnitrophota bacterium]MDD5236844.1 GTPase ObgE [Candidatus Omnitrophota bacterium]MDD5610147.1 GTPase ObgE [Candidatus Omnitrophota bacterium]